MWQPCSLEETLSFTDSGIESVQELLISFLEKISAFFFFFDCVDYLHLVRKEWLQQF